MIVIKIMIVIIIIIIIIIIKYTKSYFLEVIHKSDSDIGRF